MMPNGSILRGMMRLWFYDLGSVSFLGTGLLGFALAVLISFGDDFETIGILLAMCVVSTSAAIAWQFIRLNATEWANIVPQYQRLVLKQALLICAVVVFMCVMVAILTQAFTYVLVAAALGSGFVYVCLRRPKAFFASFFLYLCIPFMDMVILAFPVSTWLLACLSIGTFLILIARHYQQASWQEQARPVYLNGMEMGWFWLPNLRSGNVVNRVERFLHPVNFFIGPMLSMMIIGLPLVAILLAAVGAIFALDIPILFLMAQFSMLICALVHWSRVQRWRATELLWMMPGYSGRQGMVGAFFTAQLRLLSVLMGSVVLIIAVLAVMGSPAGTMIYSHIILSTFWGCSFVLGLGCVSRDAKQITLTMLVVIVQSAWVSWVLLLLRDESHSNGWIIAVNLCLSGIAIGALLWGKTQLWRKDILQP